MIKLNIKLVALFTLFLWYNSLKIRSRIFWHTNYSFICVVLLV